MGDARYCETKLVVTEREREREKKVNEKRKKERGEKKFQNPVNPVNLTQKFHEVRPVFRSSASVCLPFIPDADSPETMEKKKKKERQKRDDRSGSAASDSRRATVLVDSLGNFSYSSSFSSSRG